MLTSLLVATFCAVLLRTTQGKECDDSDIRLRKSWFRLPAKERAIFTEGFQLIRDNGKLDILTEAHSVAFMGRIHQSSLFVYYHSYLIYEMESAIRDLGGKFACFAMPYYDWTEDHNFEENPKIYNSGLGADGDANNNYCVSNDWGLQRYTTPNLCAEDETFPNCCLKRFKSSTQSLFPTSHALEGIQFGNSEDFDNSIRPSHAGIHNFIGSVPQTHMYAGYAMDDPIFPIAHSYMDLMQALWQNCHGYDLIDAAQDTIPYNVYHTYCYDDAQNSLDEEGNGMCSRIEAFLQLDDELEFIAISNVNWSLVGKGEKMTVRRLFNLEQSFNIKYDLSAYYSAYPELKGFCGGNLERIESNFDKEGVRASVYFKSMNSYFVMFLVILCVMFFAFYCKKQKEETLLGVKSADHCAYDSI